MTPPALAIRMAVYRYLVMKNQIVERLRPRCVVVAFRLTPVEAAHLDAAGAALKRPRCRADYCRAAALYQARQRVPPPVKPIRLPLRHKPHPEMQAVAKVLGELGKIGSNLNQIARVANSHGRSAEVATLEAMLRELEALRAAAVATLSRSPDPVGSCP